MDIASFSRSRAAGTQAGSLTHDPVKREPGVSPQKEARAHPARRGMR
jgi:hypothetical protein